MQKHTLLKEVPQIRRKWLQKGLAGFSEKQGSHMDRKPNGGAVELTSINGSPVRSVPAINAELAHISKEGEVHENQHVLHLHRSGVERGMLDDMKEAWKDIGQPPIAERMHRLSEALGRLAEAQKYVTVTITVVIDHTHFTNDGDTTSLEQAVDDIEHQVSLYVADNIKTAEAKLEGAQLMLDGYRQWAQALRSASTILPTATLPEDAPVINEDDIPF